MSRGEYADRQRQRDREYADAWNALSPKERKELAKAGIHGPDIPVYDTGKRDSDEHIERQPDTPMQTGDEARTQSAEYGMSTVARRLIGELLAQDNIRLTAECLALVTGMAYDGNSMTGIAERYGVTRATVSKRCVAISNALGMPPSRAQRKLTARIVYEQRARNCHSRNVH